MTKHQAIRLLDTFYTWRINHGLHEGDINEAELVAFEALKSSVSVHPYTETALQICKKELRKLQISKHQAKNKPGNNQQEIDGLNRKEEFWNFIINTLTER